MSACPTMVGRPVDGPPRCTLTSTQGTSIIAARPRFSIMRLKPGPLVTVIDLVPVHEAPTTAAMLASSSSIWMNVPPMKGKRRDTRSTTSVDGVMGYPATKRQPAAIAPSPHAKSPSRKWAPVNTPAGSALIAPFSFHRRCSPGSSRSHDGGDRTPLDFHAEDRKVGADHLAQLAVHAFTVLDHLREVVALAVEIGGQDQDVLGAVLDAELAALAALDDDANGALGNHDLVQVKGLAPILHDRLHIRGTP